MKKILVSAALLMSATVSTFAGGLLTNTNQNAIFLRNPARNAIIGIDGVYTNPAGIAFLPQGLHLSVSWQTAIQKRQITSTAPFYALNTGNPGVATKDFEGDSFAPVIPSIQAAYVINDKWSVSAQFAVGGGGGKCEFDNGLPMFEQLVGGQMNGTIHKGAFKSYSLNQTLTGEQYFYGIQLGGTYKMNDNVAFFAGVRGVIASCGYEGAIRNITLDGKTSADYAALSAQAKAAAQQYEAAGDAAQAAYYAGLATQAETAANTMKDYVLDCDQSAFGFQPILGVNVNLGKLNLAAKYEFRAKIELENESKNTPNVDENFSDYANGSKVRSDIPAILAVGAQYEILDNVRAMAGFNYYFDKDAKGSATDVKDNTWEANLGAEWDINNKWTVSLGGQRTQYSFDERMKDTNFNISSTALCLGASYRVNDMIKVNAGYMHSFYEDKDINRGNGIVDSYTRKNDVFGVSVDFKF